MSVDEQVADRRVGFHAAGMQLRTQGGILNDGSFVGNNLSSLVAPGGTITYNLYAEREQVYQIINHGALMGSDANQGNTANGLFGQVIVEPRGARIYRNTVTEEEMRLATRGTRTTPQGHPVLNYAGALPDRPHECVGARRQGRNPDPEHDGLRRRQPGGQHVHHRAYRG